MDFYDITEPGAKPRLADPRPEVRLGSEGRGRHLVIIPAVGEGDCWHVAESGGALVLVSHTGTCPKDESPGSVLVRINACGWYDRYREYRIKEACGLKILARGLFAFGDAGRVGNGEDVLAIAEVCATFRLSAKYEKYWYTWDGSAWLMETEAQHTARLALEALKEDKIRWL